MLILEQYNDSPPIPPVCESVIVATYFRVEQCNDAFSPPLPSVCMCVVYGCGCCYLLHSEIQLPN